MGRRRRWAGRGRWGADDRDEEWRRGEEGVGEGREKRRGEAEEGGWGAEGGWGEEGERQEERGYASLWDRWEALCCAGGALPTSLRTAA